MSATARSSIPRVSILAWRFAQLAATTILFKDYIAEAAVCSGESMLPTLRSEGDILLVEKVSSTLQTICRNDVIVCVSPEDPTKLICKRVIGMEGDTIALQYGGIFSTQKRIPKGHVWVEGDNASRSRDSRDFGAIPYGLIRGRALCKVATSCNSYKARGSRQLWYQMVNGSPPFKSTKHIKSGERVKASEKKHRIGLFPRLVQKISYPSEALSSAAAVSTGDPEAYGPGEETSPVRLLSTPVVAQASDVTDRDEVVRRRRQRRIRKLEHQDELQKQKSKLLTTPGERIFPLPSKVRPISLFIRMGSLPSEQEPVPLEYYGASDEGEEDKSLPLTLSAAAAATVTPHPAALQTRQLFHLGEGFATASPRQAKAIHGRPRTMPVILPFHSTALPKRPFSIQIPPMTSISSALKKDADDVDGRKRPRSLRFLDPGDQKLYAAISHEVFLAQLCHRAEERTLRRSLGDVSIADSDDDILGVTERKVNYLDSTETTARPAASSTDDSGGDTLGSAPRPPQEKTHILSLDRLCTSSAPPTLTDSMMDTEGSNPQDWALSEAIGDNDVLQRAPPPRFIGNFSRTQSMPIFPKESFSLESSDTSGCEADAEERHRSIITERRGSVAGR